ncbi:MAG: hypothetical protein HXO56_08520 [Rothia dentocariosa]|uniref:Uncharacterized protein n=1 Tax=Rothia dentocariosa TaxID=2047 RepID=A0A930PIL6_9MICC|nr:hypothetical protein [Rothia dentocariosa]
MTKYTIRYNELVEYIAEFETDVEITNNDELMNFFRENNLSDIDLDAEEDSSLGPEIDSMQLIMVDGGYV